MAEGKPTQPDQGLPGNALKNRERRRGQEKRRDPATEPTATPPPPSSGPPPKPQSDGSRLQTGPGITGGQLPSATSLAGLSWEKRGPPASSRMPLA